MFKGYSPELNRWYSKHCRDRRTTGTATLRNFAALETFQSHSQSTVTQATLGAYVSGMCEDTIEEFEALYRKEGTRSPARSAGSWRSTL